jgi:zinc transporter ZupT
VSRRSAFLVGFLSGVITLVAAVAAWVLFAFVGHRQHQKGELRGEALVDNPRPRVVRS